MGEDPNREGLVDTPNRAAKAIMFFTKGYEENVRDVVKVVLDISLGLGGPGGGEDSTILPVISRSRRNVYLALLYGCTTARGYDAIPLNIPFPSLFSNAVLAFSKLPFTHFDESGSLAA